MKIIPILAFLATAALAWQNPSGGLRATNTSDMLLNKRGTRYYNEAWSYQFLFTNGMQATLNFTYAKLGFKDPVCGADLSLANFHGHNYTVGREYPEDHFHQSANPFRIQVHEDIWMAGMPPAAHHVRFTAHKNEGFFLDLEFSGMKHGAVWGDGRFSSGDGDLSSALTIPTANVTGRIAVGRDTITVHGVAMMEHQRQSHLASDLVSSSLHTFVPGANPFYGNWTKEKNGGWNGFAIEWINGQPVLLPGASAGIDGQTPPVTAQIVSGNGSRVTFVRKSLAQSSSILDGMEGFTRWVVKKFVGNVHMYRGRAAVNGRSGIYQFLKVGN